MMIVKLPFFLPLNFNFVLSFSIYLIDHAWTYTVNTAKEMLERNVNLKERMANIMKISDSDNPSDPELIKHIMDKMWQ